MREPLITDGQIDQYGLGYRGRDAMYNMRSFYEARLAELEVRRGGPYFRDDSWYSYPAPPQSASWKHDEGWP